MSQLISCSFQQQPSPHRCRSFFDHGSKQPVEVGAALVRLARQILGLHLRVQRIRNKYREAVPRALTTVLFMRPVPQSEQIINKDEESRLIVRTNLLP
jgi:hypothetical protein